MAEHPFILEFPIQATEHWPLTNHRRKRQHRDLTLLLNVLFRGRTNLEPRDGGHFLGYTFREGDPPDVRWVQNFYFAPFGECLLDTHSPLTAERLEEIEADRYYTEPMGIDGRGLRIPSDLDSSICRYQCLHLVRRNEFNRAAYWLDMASRQWHVSMSASFAALVSTIEGLINQRGHGSAGRFRAFLDQFAPGASLDARRQMYELRCDILHGSRLMTVDQDSSILGLDPPEWDERDLYDELRTLTQVSVRNWLRNTPPV